MKIEEIYIYTEKIHKCMKHISLFGATKLSNIQWEGEKNWKQGKKSNSKHIPFETHIMKMIKNVRSLDLNFINKMTNYFNENNSIYESKYSF